MSGADESTLTGFSDLLKKFAQDGEDFTIDLPEEWLQGRTAYGGLSAAFCLEVTLRSFSTLPPLRSAYFSFIAPAVGRLRVNATIARQGKSTCFTQASIFGELGVATQASFCFGHPRKLTPVYSNLPAPEALPPEHCPPFFTWMNRPNFMQHFDGRLASGTSPCSSGSQPEMLVWLRHRYQTPVDGAVALIALADVLPPAFFGLLSEPVPISTVTWAIDFLDNDHLSTGNWWLVRSTAERAQDGFSTQVITIWSSDGRPVLSARQNIAIFANGG